MYSNIACLTNTYLMYGHILFMQFYVCLDLRKPSLTVHELKSILLLIIKRTLLH